MKTLISNCWHADIEARPTFAEVISILEEHNLLLQSPQQESKNNRRKTAKTDGLFFWRAARAL